MSQAYADCATEASGFESFTDADELDYAAYEAECALRRFPSAESRRQFLEELESRIAESENRVYEEPADCPW